MEIMIEEREGLEKRRIVLGDRAEYIQSVYLVEPVKLEGGFWRWRGLRWKKE